MDLAGVDLIEELHVGEGVEEHGGGASSGACLPLFTSNIFSPVEHIHSRGNVMYHLLWMNNN